MESLQLIANGGQGIAARYAPNQNGNAPGRIFAQAIRGKGQKDGSDGHGFQEAGLYVTRDSDNLIGLAPVANPAADRVLVVGPIRSEQFVYSRLVENRGDAVLRRIPAVKLASGKQRRAE